MVKNEAFTGDANYCDAEQPRMLREEEDWGEDPIQHEVEEKQPNKPEYRSVLPRKQQRF